MDHAHSNQASDPAARRRQYLAKKAGIAVLMVVAVLVGAIGALAFLYYLPYLNLGPLRHLWVGGVSISVPTVLAVGVAFGAFVITTRRAAKDLSAKSRSIPYVPPIREQIAALPDEVILVRASDQPAAEPGELLRAARSTTATPDAELLQPVESTTR